MNAPERSHFPGVQFRDDDPETGVTTLILTIPGMTVERPLFGQYKPNNAEVEVDFDTGSIDVRVTMHNSLQYIYQKTLPDDIFPLKSEYKVKEGALELSLAKVRPNESWSSHSDHFMRPSSPQQAV